MQRHLSPLLLCAILAIGGLPAAQAAQRTFVASNGLDAQPCTLALPCRSFQAAITAVDPGGEVVALDSAGYGPMTINKSVSVIVPPGIHAGITATAGSGVLVNSGAGGLVVLRGLYLSGTGATRGIEAVSAAALHVENCVIAGFVHGIEYVVIGGALSVLDSVVRDNTQYGIVIENNIFGSRASVVIDRTRVERNGLAGVAARSSADVTVSNSVLTGNFRGVSACAQATFEPNAVVTVEKSIITLNGVGLFVAPNDTLACLIVSSDNSITGNTIFGIEQQGGNVVRSYGDNTVFNVAGNTFAQTLSRN